MQRMILNGYEVLAMTSPDDRGGYRWRDGSLAYAIDIRDRGADSLRSGARLAGPSCSEKACNLIC